MAKKVVLIVEDQKNLALVLQSSLIKHGYDVEIAFEGEDGYNKVCSIKPDLVLLDILLPKMFGLELLEKVRKHSEKKVASVPVFVMTNYPETEYQKKAEQLKVNDFIIKSDIDLGDIVKRVDEFLKKQ